MRLLLQLGRGLSLALLVGVVLGFIRQLLLSDEWAHRMLMNVSGVVGFVAVPFVLWSLFKIFNAKLKDEPEGASRADHAGVKFGAGGGLLRDAPLVIRVIAPGLVIAALLAWMFRYETTPTAAGVAYKRDRLTGETYFVAGTLEKRVQRKDDVDCRP